MPVLGGLLYAHSLPDRDVIDWELLDTHSDAVAKVAKSHTAAFGAAGWGEVLGRCHDLGKASAAFQAKLHAANSRAAQDAGVEESTRVHRVDHSTFGARYVHTHTGPIVRELLAYCIAGHHAGLPNGRVSADASSGSTLEARLDPVRTTCHTSPIPGSVCLRCDCRFNRQETNGRSRWRFTRAA